MAQPSISGNHLESEIDRVRSLGIDSLRSWCWAVPGKTPLGARATASIGSLAEHTRGRPA